jgi:hypothetical protein
MVTMGMATLLIGLGAGVYVKMGRRSAATQAIGSVNQLVVRAKNASSKMPAMIVPDPVEGVIHAYAEEIVQELHFESRATDSGDYVPLGIEGRDCTPMGATVEADRGRIGGGLRVDGGSLNCGTFAAYDVDDGINAEVWIRPTQQPRCDIVSKGRTFLVRLEGSAGRSARIVVRLQVQDEAGSQDRVERNVEIPPVRLNDWLGIRVSYDRNEILTETSDGHGFVVRDRWKDEKRRLAVDPDQPLVVAAGLQGWIDDVRIGGVRSAEPLRLPPGVVLWGKNPPIRFVNGRLDPETPLGAAKLSLNHDGTISTFEIGPNGTVLAVRQTEAPTAAAPAEAPRKE